MWGGEGVAGRVISLHALLQDQSDGSTPHLQKTADSD